MKHNKKNKFYNTFTFHLLTMIVFLYFSNIIFLKNSQMQCDLSTSFDVDQYNTDQNSTALNLVESSLTIKKEQNQIAKKYKKYFFNNLKRLPLFYSFGCISYVGAFDYESELNEMTGNRSIIYCVYSVFLRGFWYACIYISNAVYFFGPFAMKLVGYSVVFFIISKVIMPLIRSMAENNQIN